MAIADKEGIAALSMRTLGEHLGVEAASLYNHVRNKADMLGGVVDLIMAEIDISHDASDWKGALRARAHSMHRVLLQHPWAAVLMEAHMGVGEAKLRVFEWMLDAMHRGGFSVELSYNACLAMDSYIYGFTLQEVSWPYEPEERAGAMDEIALQLHAARYPRIAEVMHFTTSRITIDYAREFDFGLELLLDGLDRLRLQGGTGARGAEGR